MKKFDLEAAKLGVPVCTRQGEPARIICFDMETPSMSYPIVALVKPNNKDGLEVLQSYSLQGEFTKCGREDSPYDLVMAPPVKKKGWVILWHNEAETEKSPLFVNGPYSSEEEVQAIIKSCSPSLTCLKISEIEWEE